MDRLKLSLWLKKYRLVLAVILVGLFFMLLPETSGQAQPAAQPVQAEEDDMESRLERILCRMEGAGEVAVMLTESSGEEIIYQSDGEKADTVLITAADRSQQGLVRTRQPPEYRGAVVLCTGADNASVRLAIVEAVSNVTGLGTDKITVLKMD